MARPDVEKLSENEQELRDWPEDIGHIISDVEGLKEAESRARDKRSAGRRRILFGVLFFAVLLISALLIWRRFNRPTEISATTAVPPSADLETGRLEIQPTDNWEYYKKTEGSVTDKSGQEILKVVQYDFYAGRFIVDNTRLRNEDTLVATFADIRDQLRDSWILIFATASLEGYEAHNLILCCQRLYAIKHLMTADAGVSSKGYWGILAGEFNPSELSGVASEEREEVKNKLARERGEKWLSEQRRLIVVTIRETQPLEANAQEKVPYVVAKFLYEQGLFPKNYQAANSMPKPLINANCGSEPTILGPRSPRRRTSQ